MTRCQVQHLHRHRRQWVDCAVKAPITMVVEGVERALCTQHRDEVRRAQAAGLASGLRWSERPKAPRPAPKVAPVQLQLVDVPASGRPRRWAS